jgi:hypothetical protein
MKPRNRDRKIEKAKTPSGLKVWDDIKYHPTSGNDRTLVIPHVVIPACPESLFSATRN